MLEILHRRLIHIGCGVGVTHGFVADEFHSVVGVDVARGALAEAQRSNPRVRYLEYDGRRLPVESGTFYVAAALCVMHYVPPKRCPLVRRAAPCGPTAGFWPSSPISGIR